MLIIIILPNLSDLSYMLNFCITVLNKVVTTDKIAIMY